MRHLSMEGLAAFLRQNPLARMLDVRTALERELHGQVPGAHHVPWHTPALEPNPAFLDEVRRRVSPHQHVLVICQRGDCSPHAAAQLEEASYGYVYNILGGYQGVDGGARRAV